MAYFRANTDVSVNIRMVTNTGSSVTGLSFSQILLTLIRAGITQNIAGLYSIAEQSAGVYRVVFNSSLMGTPDTDYVLIASDSTLQALNDTVEFTLYNESIDTVKADVDSNSAILSAKLDVVESYTSTIQPSLNDANHGLSALQTLLNNLSTQLSTVGTTIVGDINSSSSSQTTLLNQILSNEASNYSSLFTEISAVYSQFSTIASIVTTIQSAVNSGTYGLSALKTELDNIISNLAVDFGILNAAISSSSGVTDSKVDNVSSKVDTAIADILTNTSKLNTILSGSVSTLNTLISDGTVGLTSLKAELDTIVTNASLNMTSINSNIISSTGVTNTKVDLVNSNLLNDFNALTSQVTAIPTNPLLTTDSRVNNLLKLDTTTSSIPLATAQQVWSYASRYLTGASGINQIDINGFEGQFIVGNPVVVNVALLNSSGNPVTGRIYPGSLNIDLWKAGILDSSAQLATITAQETATGVYRTTIPGALINTATDYLLVVSDSSSVGLTQRTAFSAFQVAGVAGPRTVTVKIADSFTSLPIPDVQVYVKDSSNTFIINKGLTNTSGAYITGLSDGVYNLILRKSFVDFGNPTPLVVSGDTTAVYLGSSFNPSSPTSPVTSVLFGWLVDLSGHAIRNAKITATDSVNVTYSAQFKIGKVSKQTVTDSNGYWSLELIRNSQLTPTGIPYTINQEYPGFSYSKNVIIPDSSSVEFSTL